jgi:branched-subunit amino acid transport protein
MPELIISRTGGVSSLSFDNLYFLAAIPTFAVAWKTKSLFGAVVTGIAAVALARFIG